MNSRGFGDERHGSRQSGGLGRGLGGGLAGGLRGILGGSSPDGQQERGEMRSGSGVAGGLDVLGGPQKMIGFAVKNVASGIGLVSESMHSRKQGESDSRSQIASRQDWREHSNNTIEGRDIDADHRRAEDGRAIEREQGGDDALEVAWDLDDAQDDVPPEYSLLTLQSHRTQHSGDQTTDAVLANNMTLPNSSRHGPLGGLQYPVLLPQRRPKDRTRGFVRAYAPVLEHCGIDQAQWLQFLDTFEKSSQANPLIMALNLASLATMALPSVTSFMVSVAIQVATTVAAEGHARYK